MSRRRSLRVRLVLWYGIVLSVVVVLYGVAIVYQSWRTATAAVDTELTAYGRRVADALRPTPDGRFDLDLPADAAAYFFRPRPDRPSYVIWSPDGRLVDQSIPAGDAPEDQPVGRREVRLPAPGGAVVVVSRNVGGLVEARWALARAVLLSGTVTLALAVAAGWLVAGHALEPIGRIGQAAREMSTGSLDARIRVEETEGELADVAAALNQAFDRQQLALDQQRRFAADASHDLRTPIAVLRAEAEWALARERTAPQYQDALQICRRAALRLQDAVDRLIALVRDGKADDDGQTAPVALDELVADVAAWLQPLARESGIRLVVEGEAVRIAGDALQLREALGNIVSNAIRYNQPGGQVLVRTRRSGGEARIEIQDTGIGIDPASLPKVFDRFFRADQARARAPGAGLGLSIARSIVEAHGGRITCASEPGQGTALVVTVPGAIGRRGESRDVASGPTLATSRPARHRSEAG